MKRRFTPNLAYIYGDISPLLICVTESVLCDVQGEAEGGMSRWTNNNSQARSTVNVSIRVLLTIMTYRPEACFSDTEKSYSVLCKTWKGVLEILSSSVSFSKSFTNFKYRNNNAEKTPEVLCCAVGTS
jgi:hypothetical protein